MTDAGSDRSIDWRFVVLLTGLTALLTVPAWWGVDRWEGGREGLVAGVTFSLASLALGFHWVRWSVSDGGGESFVVAVLGSVTARVIATLVFALAVAWGTSADPAVALLTVVAMHIVFGLIEVAYFHRTETLG